MPRKPKNGSNINITTTIPLEIKQEIIDTGLNYNTLLIKGLEAYKGQPKIMERVEQVERRLDEEKLNATRWSRWFHVALKKLADAKGINDTDGLTKLFAEIKAETVKK